MNRLKMRVSGLRLLAMLMIVFCWQQWALAQADDSPVAYMNSINNAQADMDKKYFAYVSASAHGKRLRKVEKLRQQAVESIHTSLVNTQLLFPYKGDNSLKQSSVDYIQVCYKIFNDDYANIVNMEEISEQSVDEMQAYLLLQEKTNDKLKEINEKFRIAYKAFATKYQVTLNEDQSDKGAKMELAGKLRKYQHKVYTLFFKCNWEDNQLVKALNNKKVNDAEQCRNILIKYAEEGLKELETLRSFNGDPSLAEGCKSALLYYKKAAETDVPKLTDFYLKQENFLNMKKSFDAKSASDRKKEDVDAYNKSLKEFNASVDLFNQTNNKTNKARSEMIDNWNNAEKKFMDDNMPYFK